jgi:hypothetical protein
VAHCSCFQVWWVFAEEECLHEAWEGTPFVVLGSRWTVLGRTVPCGERRLCLLGYMSCRWPVWLKSNEFCGVVEFMDLECPYALWDRVAFDGLATGAFDGACGALEGDDGAACQCEWCDSYQVGG